MRHIKVPNDFINIIYSEGEVESEGYIENEYYHFFIHEVSNKEEDKWDGYSKSTYYQPSGGVALYKNNTFYLINRKKTMSNQSGNNVFQWITVDALTRDEIELIILTGVAGSGKTFLSLAYALEEINKEDSEYNHIVLSRPKQDLGRDEGFLPGGEDDKIAPYMMPFYDNARSMGYIQQFRKCVRAGENFGGIVFQPLEKIKGRSFENSIVIVDEAEDMRYREIESLLTRINNCKVILSGDIRQIDDKSFSKNNIPLKYAIDKFMNQDFVFQVDNPITSRKGKITEFVIDNFSEEEYRNMTNIG